MATSIATSPGADLRPTHAQQAKRLARTPDKSRLLFNTLGRGPIRQLSQSRAKRYRRPFTNSPNERDRKLDSHGRPISEIEVMSERYDSEFKQIIPVIADSLKRIVEEMSGIAPSGYAQRYAIYDTSSVPAIDVEEYVFRVAQNTFVSPASLVVAAIFIDRVLARHADLLLTNYNLFKLFFIAVRVGSKVAEVRSLSNRNFAPIGGVDLLHLNDLESKFLIDIRFDLYIHPKEFALYANQILHQCAVVSSVSYVDRLRIVTNNARADGDQQEAAKESKRRKSSANAVS